MKVCRRASKQIGSVFTNEHGATSELRYFSHCHVKTNNVRNNENAAKVENAHNFLSYFPSYYQNLSKFVHGTCNAPKLAHFWGQRVD